MSSANASAGQPASPKTVYENDDSYTRLCELVDIQPLTSRSR